ncbi:MAG: BrnT family toxin [Alphaproteobacteria bacterium]|nr:BrnT family toxin [Alphaproteobacteria bacterium]
MKFDFDANKDAANREKHGLSLAFGAKVLADPSRLEILDVRFDYAEERFIVYGNVLGRIYVCVFAERGRTRRIISVRKANERETSRYDKTPR